MLIQDHGYNLESRLILFYEFMALAAERPGTVSLHNQEEYISSKDFTTMEDQASCSLYFLFLHCLSFSEKNVT
jgi:hypothetical protein